MYNGGPGNVLYDGVFLTIRVYMGYWNKFSLVAQAATLGNFLHKRKMAADRYRSFLILEPFVLTSMCSTSFKASFVRRIQFHFLMSRSMSCVEGQGMPSMRRPGASLDRRRHGFT